MLINLSQPPADNASIDTGFSFDIQLADSYGAVVLDDAANGYRLTGIVAELDQVSNQTLRINIRIDI